MNRTADANARERTPGRPEGQKAWAALLTHARKHQRAARRRFAIRKRTANFSLARCNLRQSSAQASLFEHLCGSAAFCALPKSPSFQVASASAWTFVFPDRLKLCPSPSRSCVRAAPSSAGGYLLIRGFFKLRAFHQRFGISLPALLLLFARRYVLCLRRHHSTKPLPFQKAFPNLKISVQAHAQLRRLFRRADEHACLYFSRDVVCGKLCSVEREMALANHSRHHYIPLTRTRNRAIARKALVEVCRACVGRRWSVPLRRYACRSVCRRKYTSGELRMSLKQWLQFKREEQKEFDEAAASEEFVRLQHAATRDMASCCGERTGARGFTRALHAVEDALALICPCTYLCTLEYVCTPGAEALIMPAHTSLSTRDCRMSRNAQNELHLSC
eukprot:1037775-Pleurochrysis_carterae.AAC.3